MADLDMDMGDKPVYTNPANDDSKQLIDSCKDKPHIKWCEPEDEVLEIPEPQPEPLKIKEVIEDEEVFKGAKEQKQKRKASAKQLEHLAKAREKANRRRKENQLARQEEKLKKLKKKSPKVIKNDTSSDEESDIKIKHTEDYPSFQNFTKDDIIKLQEDAIAGYEVKRKARKEVKKKEQQENKVNQSNFDAISKATNMGVQKNDPDDIWNICFN